LITAIGTRKRREVKQCLKNGDSALACDYNGCNALHYAVRAGEKRVLAELIKCREVRRNPGAVDVPDDEGETPLHLAIKLGRTELVHELVNANADVNAPDKYGRPPLERALSANRDDIVEILLEHDANENLLIHENGIDATIWQRLSQVKQIIKLRR
jgi:ankyrin